MVPPSKKVKLDDMPPPRRSRRLNKVEDDPEEWKVVEAKRKPRKKRSTTSVPKPSGNLANTEPVEVVPNDLTVPKQKAKIKAELINSGTLPSGDFAKSIPTNAAKATVPIEAAKATVPNEAAKATVPNEAADAKGSKQKKNVALITRNEKSVRQGAKVRPVEVTLEEDDVSDLLFIKDQVDTKQIDRLKNYKAWIDDVLVLELFRTRVIETASSNIVVDPVIWNSFYRTPEYWDGSKRDDQVRLPTVPAYDPDWKTAYLPTFVNDSHWILAVVRRDPADIVYYDTKHEDPSVATKSKWSSIGYLLTGKKLNPVAAPIDSCPYQFDDYSCGPMIVMIAERLNKGMSTLFKNEIVYEWRKMAAKTLSAALGLKMNSDSKASGSMDTEEVDASLNGFGDDLDASLDGFGDDLDASLDGFGDDLDASLDGFGDDLDASLDGFGDDLDANTSIKKPMAKTLTDASLKSGFESEIQANVSTTNSRMDVPLIALDTKLEKKSVKKGRKRDTSTENELTKTGFSDFESPYESDTDDMGMKELQPETPKLSPFKLNVSTDNENIETSPVPSKSKTTSKTMTRGKKGDVTEIRSWKTEEELNQIKKENFLSSKGQKRQTKTGVKQDFVCLKRQSHKCKVTATVTFDHELSNVTIRNTHTHTEVETTTGVSNAVRELVKERLDARESVAALVIRKILRNRKVPEDQISDVKSINNYTCYEKRRRYGNIFTGNDFIKEVKKHLRVEDDADTTIAAVSSDVMLIDEEPEFFVVFSSTTLLTKFQSQKHIGVDATYKLLYHGFPVIVVGFSDEQHVFHPCAVSIVSAENTIIYENVLRAICGDADFVEIMADGALCISNVNLWKSTTLPEVAKAVETEVLNKWNNLSPNMTAYATYHKREWVDKRPNWYNIEGGGPSTNNGNESTNRTIKKAYTFRRQASMPETIEHIKDYLYEFQELKIKEYVPDLEDFIAARQLKEENRSMIQLKNTGRIVFPSSKCVLSSEEGKKAIQSYFSANPDFNEIVKFLANYYYVVQSKLFPRRFWCSCNVFRKHHKCKHALLIEISNKYQKWPDNIRILVAKIGGHRGPGRGALATSALKK